MENQMKNMKQDKETEISFNKALKEMLNGINNRSWNIVVARYGLNGNKPKTLENIGKEHKITRERVRQIIGEVIKKIKTQKNNDNFCKAYDKIRFAIACKSGIIEEQELITFAGRGRKKEEAALRFFLECLEDIIIYKKENEIKKSFACRDFNFDEWKRIKDLVKSVLEKEKRPLLGQDLYRMTKENFGLEISAEKFYHWLTVSRELAQNSFGKWGIATWKEINPRNTREKAYLVLKEVGKPLHFTKITELIDKYKLNQKKTHWQTVHNELIKDNRFVLIGRGIYGLTEWGYKAGTVKDILKDILEKNGRPMKREEIITEVLKKRQVKKSTILINLNNFFVKVGRSEYALEK